MFFFNPSRLIFNASRTFNKQYLNIRCKWLMISKKFLLSRKPNKALRGAFCGRSISEFSNYCNLDQRDFV